MRLLDSNIVIYAAEPSNVWLRAEILAYSFAVSQASRVEVLGWHRMAPEDLKDLETFLAAGMLLSITSCILSGTNIMPCFVFQLVPGHTEVVAAFFRANLRLRPGI